MANTQDFFQTVKRETLTVADAVVGFTASLYNKATNGGNIIKRVEFSVEDADVRMTRDGTTPVGDTTDTGMLIKDGTIFVINGEADIKNAKFIRNAATSAKLQVSFLTYQGVGGG
jgi:hypothetical protein